MALHPEIQEIIDTLVPMIRSGERLANVADRAMIMARRFEPRTSSEVKTSDIPRARTSECRWDDDAAFLADTYFDNYGAGVNLCNLAVDRIRAQDDLDDTTTVIIP